MVQHGRRQQQLRSITDYSAMCADGDDITNTSPRGGNPFLNNVSIYTLLHFVGFLVWKELLSSLLKDYLVWKKESSLFFPMKGLLELNTWLPTWPGALPVFCHQSGLIPAWTTLWCPRVAVCITDLSTTQPDQTGQQMRQKFTTIPTQFTRGGAACKNWDPRQVYLYPEIVVAHNWRYKWQ